MATCLDGGVPAIVGYSTLWFLMFAGWVIQLAGVGRTTELCMENLNSDSGDVNCGYFHALDWWTVALQFMVVVLVIVSMFTEGLNRGVVSAMVAISTVQLTLQANTYFMSWRALDVGTRPAGYLLYGEDMRTNSIPNTSSSIGLAISTVCAGNIIELVTNYIWLFVFSKFVATAAEPKAVEAVKA